MANEAKQFTINGVTHDVMDVGARQLIADLQTAIDAITSGDTTTAIKTFQEVIDFLDGVTDDATLIGKLNELRTLINTKVDKVTGKGLSTEDYTTAEKQKLAGLSNYDDSALQTAVTNLQTAITNVYTKAQTYSKTEVDDKVANAGKVQSVSVNGTNHTPNLSGVVDLGTVPTKEYVDDAVDDKLTEVTVNAVGNSASMYFAGSALCISTANLIQVTATPTITYVDNEQNVVVSISGSGTLKAYLDGVEQTLANGSFTIAKTSVAQNVVVTATAKEDGKAISAEAELTIEVGAYIDRTNFLEGYGTSQSDFSIYLDNSSDPVATAVVDTTDSTTSRDGTTLYKWEADLSEYIRTYKENHSGTAPTELVNFIGTNSTTTPKNIFSNIAGASNSTIYKITNIPQNFTTLSAFIKCSKLESVNLAHITSLSGKCFVDCNSLPINGVLDLTDSEITSLSQSAISKISGLVTLKLPSTLSSIGNQSLAANKSLVNLYLAKVLTDSGQFSVMASSAGSNALNACSALEHIYVPVNTRSYYVSALTTALSYLEKSTDIIEEISE